MNAREEAIDSSFSEVKKVLEALAAKGKQDHFDYKDILFNLIASASEVVAGDRLELVLNLWSWPMNPCNSWEVWLFGIWRNRWKSTIPLKPN